MTDLNVLAGTAERYHNETGFSRGNSDIEVFPGGRFGLIGGGVYQDSGVGLHIAQYGYGRLSGNGQGAGFNGDCYSGDGIGADL